MGRLMIFYTLFTRRELPRLRGEGQEFLPREEVQEFPLREEEQGSPLREEVRESPQQGEEWAWSPREWE